MEEQNKEFEKLKEKINFVKLPPPPVPGPFYMEMIPNIDLKTHSSALDQNYKSLYTPITTFFPFDILKEIKEMEKDKTETWLKRSSNIDSVFYQEKNERNEIFMRNESKSNIEDLLDYNAFLKESFDAVMEVLDCDKFRNNYIVEEYPLVPEQNSFILITGAFDDTKDKSFIIEPSETSLIDKVETENTTYNSTKLNVDDKICVEIRDGKAFYSFVKCIYKFSRLE